LAAAPRARLIGIDRDPTALAAARARLADHTDRVTLIHGELGDIRSILADLGILHVHGFLADLGVSSPQLDHADRGFSFSREGPLDMRMDPTCARPMKSTSPRSSATSAKSATHDASPA
jgi:16S rRNA (cytosine1402-N4)-methyltransferase